MKDFEKLIKLHRKPWDQERGMVQAQDAAIVANDGPRISAFGAGIMVLERMRERSALFLAVAELRDMAASTDKNDTEVAYLRAADIVEFALGVKAELD